MGAGGGRLILVSNRLPVTVRSTATGLEVVRSAGGLASALQMRRRRAGDVWIGWPGQLDGLSEEQQAHLDATLAELGTQPVYLDAGEAELFYEGFANGVLWPLFHYITGVLPLRVVGWPEYVRVNERFADAVAQQYREGDVIWVHDYHLMLLPRLIRDRLPQARIGFFLHTPFPSSELFATLPHREQLLDGLLGADLVGFHTTAYRRHFESALEHVADVRVADGVASDGERPVQLGVYPIGVDAVTLEQNAARAEVAEEVAKLRGDGSCRLLVGVDRLDYTKGIPRRLLAVEELLSSHPEWRGAVRLVQISVPSREGVGAYQNFRREVEALVGRINSRFGTPHWMPLHYLYRSVSMDQLLALYRAADAVLVTPVRDGMNLVAKEFVAARSDEDGVLVLSEFAGAAAELTDAVLVNPYDVGGTAAAIDRSLRMERAERQERMRRLRARVAAYDVHWWTASFLKDLAATPAAVQG